ncbi:SPOR domain-containing protein [soil metagenome]
MKSQQTSISRQHGGTLMGVIIGLVVGLAIAVAVALLITKSSTPFTNKNGKSDKQDLPVAQMQDPNKPLYGNKDAVKDAAKDFARADSAKPAETATTHAEVKPDTKAGVTVAEKPVEKKVEKVADKAKAEAEAEAKAKAVGTDVAPKTDAVDEKYIYFLQAGAFREPSDAESARAKLALIGFEARISEKGSDNGTLYRVRIGPFNQLETMNRMRSKLSENSVDVAVVRTAK